MIVPLTRIRSRKNLGLGLEAGRTFNRTLHSLDTKVPLSRGLEGGGGGGVD
jgi:hypothetical protein